MIDFTLIGTAATMPLPERALSAAVLRWDGCTILFDCGEGTQTAARKAKVSLMKTDIIALTHYHGDHIFGLPGLLQSMDCLGRKSPLLITGPEGIEEALTPILKLAGNLQFEIKTVSGEIHMKGATLKPFEANHRVSAVGYVFSLPRPPKFLADKAKKLGIPVKLWSKIQKSDPETVFSFEGMEIKAAEVMGEERRGLKLVFSGDTAPCESMTRAAENADLLVCDATYGEDSQADLAEKYGHCTFRQAAETAAEARVRRLWLTHYSQIIKDPGEYLPEAKSIFSETECGRDGMSIKLAFED